MTDDIKKQMQSISGMGERIKIISSEMRQKAQEMEELARTHDRLTQTKGITRAEMKFYTTGSYERATVSFSAKGDLLRVHKEWVLEQIRDQIQTLMEEIEALKEKI
jgi:hypothetical protein